MLKLEDGFALGSRDASERESSESVSLVGLGSRNKEGRCRLTKSKILLRQLRTLEGDGD